MTAYTLYITNMCSVYAMCNLPATNHNIIDMGVFGRVSNHDS